MIIDCNRRNIRRLDRRDQHQRQQSRRRRSMSVVSSIVDTRMDRLSTVPAVQARTNLLYELDVTQNQPQASTTASRPECVKAKPAATEMCGNWAANLAIVFTGATLYYRGNGCDPVSVCVCHKSKFYRNGWAERIELVLTRLLPSTYSVLFYEDILVPPK